MLERGQKLGWQKVGEGWKVKRERRVAEKRHKGRGGEEGRTLVLLASVNSLWQEAAGTLVQELTWQWD